MKVLILGGTGEARALAAACPYPVVTSLAGRVRDPALPSAGEVRVGGFGGPEGLAGWLREAGIGAVVDATHPFAERISANAVTACATAGVPLLVLRRPGWTAGPDDNWHRVPSVADAAAALPSIGERVFLTTGRQGLATFAPLDLWFLVRTVDPPEGPVPGRMELLLDRGPYLVAGELALMRRHAIDVLVTKDSGGGMTTAKLTAARELGLPVVMVDRPQAPAAPSAGTVEEALAWLSST
ncbi:cobalt-precorrin-6A reductase [Longispora albida]|uniref:cobalt-precorrin-6A reductase n=1 Tax=Longispora albida TaxID=203523 RepID=UPI0003655D99|nr:cobalt-precorrin-6A reductase [Longispora albida]